MRATRERVRTWARAGAGIVCAVGLAATTACGSDDDPEASDDLVEAPADDRAADGDNGEDADDGDDAGLEDEDATADDGAGQDDGDGGDDGAAGGTLTGIPEGEVCALLPGASIEAAFGIEVDDAQPAEVLTDPDRPVVQCQYTNADQSDEPSHVLASVQLLPDDDVDELVDLLPSGDQVDSLPGTALFTEEDALNSIRILTQFEDGTRMVQISVAGDASADEIEPLAQEMLGALDGG